MKLHIKRKIALATAAGCLLAMSSATAWAQGNSVFGRGQRTNHFKGRGNSLFGRTNAMTHSAGHGNSAFGLGQFNEPLRGSGNSAFGRGGGGRHFASMPSRGGQTFTRGMGTWSGQRWGGRNWSGSNWSGSNWGRNWHHDNDIIFIGDFGFPVWWGWYPWGWGYPYGYYDYGYPYDSYGYGYGAYGYGYGYGDNGYGYPYGGYYGSNYGGTDNGNGYPTHSRVAELQRRLARAGYYSGDIDGIMGPATRRAIRAYERDHGYTG